MLTKTEFGFEAMKFTDSNNTKCSLQQAGKGEEQVNMSSTGLDMQLPPKIPGGNQMRLHQLFSSR